MWCILKWCGIMKFVGISFNELRIMGVINIFLESFYKGSVRNDEEKLIEIVLRMVEEGVSFIDIGVKFMVFYLEI